MFDQCNVCIQRGIHEILGFSPLALSNVQCSIVLCPQLDIGCPIICSVHIHYSLVAECFLGLHIFLPSWENAEVNFPSLGRCVLWIFIFLNIQFLLLLNLHKAWVKTGILGNDVLLLPLPLGLDDPPGVRRLQPLHRRLHLPDEAPGQDDGWSYKPPSKMIPSSKPT